MPDLKQQLKAAARFFTPENLAELTLKYEGEMALLVIDVQKKFCDPQCGSGDAETDAISKRISSIVPEFRKAGIPVYAVYYSDYIKKTSDIDFHEFMPEENDVLVGKNRDSAFSGSDIKRILKEDKRKLLLACGFNLGACVERTVIDARGEGFDVCLLSDLTGDRLGDPNSNKNRYNRAAKRAAATLETMREKGIVIAESGKILEQLRAMPAPAQADKTAEKSRQHWIAPPIQYGPLDDLGR